MLYRMGTEFCWLLELRDPRGGVFDPALYLLGVKDAMDFTTTDNPRYAMRFMTKEAAESMGNGLIAKRGIFQAVQHGFG